jgi:hypothetical protein
MSALSKGPNRVGVSLSSPEDENSFPNVMFSNYLEFRTMDEVHKVTDSYFFTLYFIEDPSQ